MTLNRLLCYSLYIMQINIQSFLESSLGYSLANSTVMGLALWQWIGLFTVLLSALVISSILARVFASVVSKIILNKASEADIKTYPIEKLNRPINIMFLGWIFLIGLYTLHLAPFLLSTLVVAAKVMTYYGVVTVGWNSADILQIYLAKKAKATENKFDDLLAPLICRSIKVTFFIIGAFSIAEILKLPISSLLAGLGIGGIAIAMAAKETVANVFGSLTILVDHPFSIGDWVVIGDVEGTVEHVGFRSTRLRTFYNSLVTVPNAEMLTAKVDNMGERSYRRIKTTLSLTYDTSPEKIEAFCVGVRKLIDDHPITRKDYYHVYFNGFNDSSLDILLYCFLETSDWGAELNGKHDLFLSIVKLAKELGVEFAFPTRTLHMNSVLPTA
jgi:MscS family membrane protein